MLAINELPDVDYIFFRDQWIQGTNDWILEDDRYREWLNAEASRSVGQQLEILVTVVHN